MLREMVFAPVAEQLAEVERRIQARIWSRADLISEVTTYVLGSGGKRVRPALLLLSARTCGYDGRERDVDLAVVAEFMHVATLIHDDIIDNANMRRGQPSANARWGPHISVLAGDFLYSHSIQRLVDDGDFRILKAFADATVAMTEGEILELRWHRNPDILYQDYLTIITCKTAALFSAACRTGALIAEVDGTQVEAFTEFGLNLGIGFQLVDDALDFTASEAMLGKPVGNDLLEGKVTYPLIHVLHQDRSPERDQIRHLICNGDLREAEVETIRQYVRERGGIQAAVTEAREYLTKARGKLVPFPDTAARRSLEILVDFIADREW
ncbi:MAG: polyprenyl synthetase family protein [Candidatus Methylomirabilales bacterium]